MITDINSQNMRLLWRECLLVFVLAALFMIYLLFLKPSNNDELATLIDNVIQGVLEGVGLFLTLPLFLPDVGQKKHSFFLWIPSFPKTPQRWVPFLFGLGILSYVIGQALWTYNENIARLQVLFPTGADAGYLGSYPFVFLAILLLPSQRLLAETRTRVALEGLMIMVGAVTFTWYFILGPTVLAPGPSSSMPARIVGSAYPLATLVLLLCLLLVMTRANDHTMRPVVLILSIALIIIIITDSIYDYQELYSQYKTGTLLDLGWPLGYMLVGLGARAIYLTMITRSTTSLVPTLPSSQQVRDHRGPLSQFPWLCMIPSLVPYLLVPALVVLLAYIRYTDRSNTPLEIYKEIGTYVCVAVLTVLVSIRQIFIILEAGAKNREMWMMQREVQEKNEALNYANIQLENSYKQQYHLNRLKDQFIANVTHELRTPLTLVYGYLELLSSNENEYTDSVMQTKFLKYAKDGCEELTLLINNILDAIHINKETQSPPLEEVSVAEVVHEVCEHFAQKKEQGDRLKVEVPSSFRVCAHQQYFRQIVRNLLSNALKYSPEGTPVTVSAQLITDIGPPQVCISVQDIGPGIPPDEKPLLFQKFVRLERDLSGPIRGTGLGLYISKQLVESMNGKIWVESSGREGEGSCFSFILLAASSTSHDEQIEN